MSRWASGLHSMRECFFESQNEHIHSVLFFFPYFWAVGTSRQSDLFRRFQTFFITPHENIVSAFFFTALLRCGHTLKMFLFVFLCCFCKLLIVISTSCVGHILGHVLVMRKENLDFIMFFTAFWSCGHLFKGVIFIVFWSFLSEVCVFMSLWACVLILVTETDHLDSALFLIEFWGCVFLEEDLKGFWWGPSDEILCQIQHFP